jgi:hypothetical protein
MRRAVEWADRRVPPGVRSVLGVLLMAGGVLGFLPLLGFWMLPIGLAFIALDIPPLRRRLLTWLKRRDRRPAAAETPQRLHRSSGAVGGASYPMSEARPPIQRKPRGEQG